MAKRDARPTGDTTTTNTATAAPADAMQQSVVAFAQQLGRIAGTLQARAEGLMDREAVNRQIASVRDGAADLLDELSAAATRASAMVKTNAPAKAAQTSAKKAAKSPAKSAAKTPAAPAAAAGVSKGRSRGAVDAPGKKHRKPPANPDAHLASSQAAKMRAAMPMEKTNRRRGRG